MIPAVYFSEIWTQRRWAAHRFGRNRGRLSPVDPPPGATAHFLPADGAVWGLTDGSELHSDHCWWGSESDRKAGFGSQVPHFLWRLTPSTSTNLIFTWAARPGRGLLGVPQVWILLPHQLVGGLVGGGPPQNLQSAARVSHKRHPRASKAGTSQSVMEINDQENTQTHICDGLSLPVMITHTCHCYSPAHSVPSFAVKI